MADQKKLDRWAEQLLDTGKRNNLINFRDTKTSTAEVLFPDAETVFSKCSVGHVFEVFDPKIPDEDIDDSPSPNEDAPAIEDKEKKKKLTREEYLEAYRSRIKKDRYLLAFGQPPNPIKAVKNIAKKAQTMLDETGINAAHLAFGFLKWREKENSDVFYRAPLLLVHINLITGSVLDPIKVEISDDDITVNPTFNFLLQAEYGLTLPEFEDGETLSHYYSKLAYTVRGLGWEILNECKIGVFSFLKLNMYEDLKNNAAHILQNKNIRALLGEPIDTDLPFAESLEAKPVKNPLVDLHTVVDADSSQIEAIEMAKSGKSFVLQGPPGTGKSQTITNIIAECLYDGKKILFVSEKQAALNVVFDKLKKAGLADFCLELHSHKANKKAVIEELNRTLEIPKKGVSSSAEDEIRQKEEAQQRLDEYANELHKKRKVINKSLFQLFEAYSPLRDYPDVKLSLREIIQNGEDYLHKAVPLLKQYIEYLPSIGSDYHQNVWYGYNASNMDFETRMTIKDDLETLISGYTALQTTAREMQMKYGTPELNYDNTVFWQSLLSFAGNSNVITPALLTKERLDYAMPRLAKMRQLSQTISSTRNALFSSFNEEFAQDYIGKDLYTALTGKYASFASRAFFSDYKSLLSKLQTYTKQEEKLKYQQAVQAAELLMNLQYAQKNYDDTESDIQGCLGSCYHGSDTNWNDVINELNRLQTIMSDCPISFCGLAKMDSATFKNMQAEFRTDAQRIISQTSSVSEAQHRIALQSIDNTLNLNTDSYSYCIGILQERLDAIGILGEWVHFSTLLQEMDRLNLRCYIDKVIEQQLPADMIVDAFRKLFYRTWIEYILFSVPELASFSRVKHDQAVQIFTEKDNLQYAISKAQINSELSQRRPNLDMITGGSAVAILRREGAKKRKQMPIRKLLLQTGSLVQRLKPCFLMSPLSVSTFLDPDMIEFDTVIFDEASQIFPQDAVGAIYRGKQLIVVGDTR